MYLLKSIRRVSVSCRQFITTRDCHSDKSSMVYTNKMYFINKSDSDRIPTYRVLDDTYAGHSSHIPELKVKVDENMLINMYKSMVSLNIMDTILYESQRQGRISFYMTSFGEEGVQIGSAAALCADDLIYAQYRESGVLLWRGYNFQDFVNQCYGNERDINKGRQMPVHYGSKNLNFVTISSPLATQLPQAVGAGYGLKLLQKNVCIACYFGEGAASEGDAHAAFNFASTLACPVIFICRNNGYAISTPSYQQYNGDGIASKGPAYGISTIRVDGNDIIAIYTATKFARDYVLRNKKPVLIEAMTYRIGHHSTSDDSTAYRSNQEVDEYLNVVPIKRLKKYLENLNLWNNEKEEELINLNKKLIMNAIEKAEKLNKPYWEDLFTDVYHEMPSHIINQMRKMQIHVTKYAEQYKK